MLSHKYFPCLKWQAAHFLGSLQVDTLEAAEVQELAVVFQIELTFPRVTAARAQRPSVCYRSKMFTLECFMGSLQANQFGYMV